MSNQSSIYAENFLLKLLEALIKRQGLPVDERRRRVFLLLFLLTAIPALISFTLWHAFTFGLTKGVLLMIFTIAIGVMNFFWLCYAKQTTTNARIGALAILALLTYLLATGGGYGVGFLWFFVHPLVAFFLFGDREGAGWVVLSWLLCFLVTIMNVGSYDYPWAAGLRFMVAYTLVSLLAYGLEAGRKQYYDQLAAEKVALETALQQVKTLQGLLPICASCKKIRDDGGYWHQVESYMHHHAGIEFSHSICPECRTQPYPKSGQTVAPIAAPATRAKS